MRLFSMYSWNRQRHVLNAYQVKFIGKPWAGGVVLLVCVAIAMLLANLPFTAEIYHNLLHTNLSLNIGYGDHQIIFPKEMTLEKAINDGLMVIFFFTVGLEIKRELLFGQLSSPKKALLPVMAALGGMLAPAAIYTIFNYGTPAESGWGIPTATDIAFAVGILSMLGDRVPVSLKVFLTALAIADDLGAIVVIALFYGGTIEWGCLGVAMLVMGFVLIQNLLGEKRQMYYLVPAIIVWSLFYYSGVHSTISGVAMAMLIPTKPRFSKEYFLHKCQRLTKEIYRTADTEETFPATVHRYYLRRIGRLAYSSIGMSYRLEHRLSPYVTFIIMPIFALANAGVVIPSVEYFNIFDTAAISGATGLGVFFGLLIGKPLGILIASFLAVKSGLAEKPAGASWKMLLAVACLGGIGFTMSIFVDTLAFSSIEHINSGKIAILMGSTAAAILGTILIILFSRKK